MGLNGMQISHCYDFVISELPAATKPEELLLSK